MYWLLEFLFWFWFFGWLVLVNASSPEKRGPSLSGSALLVKTQLPAGY